MDPDSPRSHLQQHQQARADEQTQQSPSGLAFDSPEELLRHDRTATPVPEAVESRLKQSLAVEPPPPRPWWKRLLGR